MLKSAWPSGIPHAIPKRRFLFSLHCSIIFYTTTCISSALSGRKRQKRKRKKEKHLCRELAKLRLPWWYFLEHHLELGNVTSKKLWGNPDVRNSVTKFQGNVSCLARKYMQAIMPYWNLKNTNDHQYIRLTIPTTTCIVNVQLLL